MDFLHLDVFDGYAVPDQGFPARTVAPLRADYPLFEVHLTANDPLPASSPPWPTPGPTWSSSRRRRPPCCTRRSTSWGSTSCRPGCASPWARPWRCWPRRCPCWMPCSSWGGSPGRGNRGRDFNDLVLDRVSAVRRMIDAQRQRRPALPPVDLQAAGAWRERLRRGLRRGATSLPLGERPAGAPAGALPAPAAGPAGRATRRLLAYGRLVSRQPTAANGNYDYHGYQWKTVTRRPLKRTRARPGRGGGGGRTREGARIADVALRAGVSVATVSRVLSPSGHGGRRPRSGCAWRRRSTSSPRPSPGPWPRGPRPRMPAGSWASWRGSDHPHLAGMLRGAEEVGRPHRVPPLRGPHRAAPGAEVGVRPLPAAPLSRRGPAAAGERPGGGQRTTPAWASAWRRGGGPRGTGGGGGDLPAPPPVPRVVVDKAPGDPPGLGAICSTWGTSGSGSVAGPAVVVSLAEAHGVRRALSERFLRADPGLVAPSDLTMEGGRARGRAPRRPAPGGAPDGYLRRHRPAGHRGAAAARQLGPLGAGRPLRGGAGGQRPGGRRQPGADHGAPPPAGATGALAMETLLARPPARAWRRPHRGVPPRRPWKCATPPPLPAGKGKRKKGKKGKESARGERRRSARKRGVTPRRTVLCCRLWRSLRSPWTEGDRERTLRVGGRGALVPR